MFMTRSGGLQSAGSGFSERDWNSPPKATQQRFFLGELACPFRPRARIWLENSFYENIGLTCGQQAAETIRECYCVLSAHIWGTDGWKLPRSERHMEN